MFPARTCQLCSRLGLVNYVFVASSYVSGKDLVFNISPRELDFSISPGKNLSLVLYVSGKDLVFNISPRELVFSMSPAQKLSLVWVLLKKVTSELVDLCYYVFG